MKITGRVKSFNVIDTAMGIGQVILTVPWGMMTVDMRESTDGWVLNPGEAPLREGDTINIELTKP